MASSTVAWLLVAASAAGVWALSCDGGACSAQVTMEQEADHSSLLQQITKQPSHKRETSGAVHAARLNRSRWHRQFKEKHSLDKRSGQLAQGQDPACNADAPDCATDADLTATGCTLIACCNQICDVDPFCCGVGWDEVCRNRAMVECAPQPLRPPQCRGQASNSCSQPSPQGGCSEPVCCSIICTQVNSSCCSNSWDISCVQDAEFFCVDS
eukprot:TRINITY_DN72652_c0_g1_i1.p2 TRINITY_DN72652_c0_g1~~TRINITY_DN72652_c0_g1_i1.p2  ORF type:complete len:212 (+),score=32.09 TRINITY_DN72652_c0_g1_i1:102-737(+)